MKLGCSDAGKCFWSLWRKLSSWVFPSRQHYTEYAWSQDKFLLILYLYHDLENLYKLCGGKNPKVTGKQLCNFGMTEGSTVRLKTLWCCTWCKHAPCLSKYVAKPQLFFTDFPAQNFSKHYKRISSLLQSGLHKMINVILIRLCWSVTAFQGYIL